MASSDHVQIDISAIVKGYHECTFQVKDKELYRVEHKVGERGNTFRICSSRGQVGHLVKELVPLLWPVQTKMVW